MRQVLLPLCDLVAPLVLNLHTKVRKANLFLFFKLFNNGSYN